MYIIYKAYDDNTAEILDVGTYQKRELTEKELINFNKEHDVLGLSATKQKINYIEAYSCVQFSMESEADEYIKENNLSYRNKRYIQGLYWVFEKSNKKIHVDYYVCAYAGKEVLYLAEKGYTPYIQAAKVFDKRSAGKAAALATKNSKTGKYWTTQRVKRE